LIKYQGKTLNQQRSQGTCRHCALYPVHSYTIKPACRRAFDKLARRVNKLLGILNATMAGDHGTVISREQTLRKRSHQSDLWSI